MSTSFHENFSQPVNEKKRTGKVIEILFVSKAYLFTDKYLFTLVAKSMIPFML